MAARREIQTDERLPLVQAVPLALQHLMAMFGATVLVPVLTGLDPSVAIMTSGAGTILYLLLTKGRIPSYLGSSFAFIAPIIAVASTRGIPAALGGLVVAGLVYVVVAALIKSFGTRWLDRVLPPALVGAVVIVIGLGLAGVAVKMSVGANHAWTKVAEATQVHERPDATSGTLFALEAGETVQVLPAEAEEPLPEGWTQVAADDGTSGFAEGIDASASSGYYWKYVLIAAVTLGAAIVFSSFFKGFLATIPVLLGIVVGYATAAFMGFVDFGPVLDAAWVGLPQLTFPRFDLGAILIIAPVALVVIIEHIGHLLVVNEIVGKDFTPMLPESLTGDGLATALSAAVGGTPSTTYAENIGVMAVTRVYATQIFWYAGALAFVIGGFVPKLGWLIRTTPEPVMGGVSLLLFGLIASSGLRMLVESGIDYGHSRNLILSSVVLVVGIGMESLGVQIPIGADYVLPGMATATLLGVLLNLILPGEAKTLAAEMTADSVTSGASQAAEEAGSGRR